MWTVTLLDDPLSIPQGAKSNSGFVEKTGLTLCQTRVALSTCLLSDLVGNYYETIRDAGSVALVALADYIARTLASRTLSLDDGGEFKPIAVRLEPLDCTTRHNLSSQQQLRGLQSNPITHRKSTNVTPYVLERSDIAILLETQSDTRKKYKLHAYLRVFVYTTSIMDDSIQSTVHDNFIRASVATCMNKFLDFSICGQSMTNAMTHVAIVLLQDKMRSILHDTMNAVAFVANGAVLPRKSGASTAPMACPPALPFAAPEQSNMNQTIHVDIGLFAPFIVNHQRMPTLSTKRFQSMASLFHVV
jgi:Predicted ATPase of the ABC class